MQSNTYLKYADIKGEATAETVQGYDYSSFS